ncbi:MAG: hypothetical protein JWM40_267 [Frankiales bacterium]|nr:hypothetical protein [Frankiales bacterium]
MRRSAWVLAAALVGGLVAPAGAADAPRVVALSNRADLVSGGDVLVEVRLPSGTRLREVLAGSRDVTPSFSVVSGRTRGLVTGLPVGVTRLTARTAAGGVGWLTVTNHPSTGPVFAGPQVQPWVCDTASHGLGPARDKSCSTPSVTTYVYKSVVTGRFADYDPLAPPSPLLVAGTTTDQGVHAPFVVRVEKGVQDRGLYTIAVLADPAKPWTPLKPQPTWNGKVGSPFGGSCNPRHQQEPVDTGPNELQPTLFSVLDEPKLAKGFMVAHSNLGNLGSNCNDVVAAEALMMLKEHVVETFGPIRRTIGYGCSGGSMLEHQIAAAYPGMLDGIIPACSFPDVWSTITESEDCHLLDRVFDNDPTWLPHQRAAVSGYQTPVSCLAFDKLPINSTQSWLDPLNAPNCGDLVPAGPRCSVQDYQVAQLGRRPDGFANRPYDNVGVTYGLRAFQAGTITAEQLVALNEQIGSDDINWKPTTARARGTGLRSAYAGGRVVDAHLLSAVPILDLRGSSNQEIHTDYHSWAMRARLDEANGTHANQVIWTSHPLTIDPLVQARSFFAMDSWLDAIDRDQRPIPRARKVAVDKPSALVDSCFVAGRQITDLTLCGLAFPYYGDPRTAAGGRLSGGVLACALKPAARLDGMTDSQWKRWRAVFRTGVCDPIRAGREQVRAIPWATYPNGRPEPLG